MSGGDGNEMISSVTTRTLSGTRWGHAGYVRLAAARACAFNSDDATHRRSQKRLQSLGGGRTTAYLHISRGKSSRCCWERMLGSNSEATTQRREFNYMKQALINDIINVRVWVIVISADTKSYYQLANVSRDCLLS